MRKYWLVYTTLFGTGYFVGLFKRLKDAEEVCRNHDGYEIEEYWE